MFLIMTKYCVTTLSTCVGALMHESSWQQWSLPVNPNSWWLSEWVCFTWQPPESAGVTWWPLELACLTWWYWEPVCFAQWPLASACISWQTSDLAHGTFLTLWPTELVVVKLWPSVVAPVLLRWCASVSIEHKLIVLWAYLWFSTQVPESLCVTKRHVDSYYTVMTHVSK